MIKSPKTGNPGIHENAKKVIKRTRSKCKKRQQDSTKHMNFATTHFSNFNNSSKERIWQQVFTSVSVTPSETARVASSITGITGGTSATSPGKDGPKLVVFLFDTQELNTDIH